ncbi:MAG: EamA family transporter, partial [Microcoleus sp.]
MSKNLEFPDVNSEKQRNVLDDNELMSALIIEDKTIVSGNQDNLNNGELAEGKNKIWAVVS